MPSTFRRDWITKPIFRLAQRALPRLSATESEAIEAGDVWWDAALFSGNPDWSRLLATPAVHLSEAESTFLAGPVEQLCRMIDDWRVRFDLFDLPEPGVWDVEVMVEGPHGPATVRLEVEAAEAAPRWRTLWPWFGWPALAVVLFGVHRLLARRRR